MPFGDLWRRTRAVRCVGRAPLRQLISSGVELEKVLKDEVPAISLKHFEKSLSRVRASVHPREPVMSPSHLL
jgi:hypothetical protein